MRLFLHDYYNRVESTLVIWTRIGTQHQNACIPKGQMEKPPPRCRPVSSVPNSLERSSADDPDTMMCISSRVYICILTHRPHSYHALIRIQSQLVFV